MTRKPGRKLLVASVGVASVSYVLACTARHTSGNLVIPHPSTEPPIDDPVAQPEPPDAGDGGEATLAPDASAAELLQQFPKPDAVGNLMPPPAPTPPPKPKQK